MNYLFLVHNFALCAAQFWWMLLVLWLTACFSSYLPCFNIAGQLTFSHYITNFLPTNCMVNFLETFPLWELASWEVVSGKVGWYQVSRFAWKNGCYLHIIMMLAVGESVDNNAQFSNICVWNFWEFKSYFSPEHRWQVCPAFTQDSPHHLANTFEMNFEAKYTKPCSGTAYKTNFPYTICLKWNRVAQFCSSEFLESKNLPQILPPNGFSYQFWYLVS